MYKGQVSGTKIAKVIGKKLGLKNLGKKKKKGLRRVK